MTDADALRSIAASLWQAAHVPLTTSTLRKLLHTEGWLLDEAFDDMRSWRRSGLDGPLTEYVIGDRVTSIYVPTFTYDVDDARAVFDGELTRAVDAAVSVIGPPLAVGEDADEHKHQWRMWKGKTAFVFVLQCLHEDEPTIASWLESFEPDAVAPRPGAPLIDWLWQRGRARADADREAERLS